MPGQLNRNLEWERETEMDIINKETNEEASQDYLRINFEPFDPA